MWHFIVNFEAAADDRVVGMIRAYEVLEGSRPLFGSSFYVMDLDGWNIDSLRFAVGKTHGQGVELGNLSTLKCGRTDIVRSCHSQYKHNDLEYLKWSAIAPLAK
jgi:hypothetical protein